VTIGDSPLVIHAPLTTVSNVSWTRALLQAFSPTKTYNTQTWHFNLRETAAVQKRLGGGSFLVQEQPTPQQLFFTTTRGGTPYIVEMVDSSCRCACAAAIR